MVDDEPEIRRALRTGLGYQGFDVRAAASGEEGLAQIAAWRPDVVLLDLGLPGIDGFEVLQELRNRDRRAAVIVVSALERNVAIDAISATPPASAARKKSMASPV